MTMTKKKFNAFIFLCFCAVFMLCQFQGAHPSLAEETSETSPNSSTADTNISTDVSPDANIGPDTTDTRAENNVQSHTITQMDMDDFGLLPVLHEGRFKPLSSLADITITRIAGGASVQGLSALDIMALILFDPGNVAQFRMFYIRDAKVLKQLGLDEVDDKRQYYSLLELLPRLENTDIDTTALLAKKEADLTGQQKAFLKLSEDVLSVTNFMRSLSLILPLNLVIPDAYKDQIDDETAINFLDVVGFETALREDMRGIMQKKGTNPEAYSNEEKKKAALLYQINQIRSSALGNQALKILPQAWNAPAEAQALPNWLSPWALIMAGQSAPETAAYFNLWKDIALAYRTGNQEAWKTASSSALVYANDNFQGAYSAAKFQAEEFYHVFKPYGWTLGLYLFACALLALHALRPLSKPIIFGAYTAMAAALCIHFSAIGLRIYILGRPPIGTLYESVLFVAFICGAFGFWFALKRREHAALFASAITAAGLLMLAPITAPDAENLNVLVAVLNTSFWLATHVVIITCGYGICVLAGGLSHLYMILRFLRGKKDEICGNLSRLIYKTSIMALLFTAVGTVLGGIWADQSWGRFWGWDPKENGALLIVLWLIWVQHGRLSNHLRDLSFIAMSALLNIIVGLAWFGVNLLNVGLHSYGFTSGIAYGLGIFCAIEILFVGGFFIAIRIKELRLQKIDADTDTKPIGGHHGA